MTQTISTLIEEYEEKYIRDVKDRAELRASINAKVVSEIQDLIDNHPDWDDEDIADELLNEE